MKGARPGAPVVPGTFRSLLVMAGVWFVAVVLTSVGNIGDPNKRWKFALVGWALLWILAVVCFVPGFLLAEKASARWGHRAWTYATIVLLGSAAVAIATVALSDAWGLFAGFHGSRGKSAAVRSFIAFLEVSWRVGLAAILYGNHRRALAATLAVQELETRRTEMMARLADSRLRTMRARVQPEAFIEELRALRTRYLEVPAAAEAALDMMIVRLRAASRGAAS